MHFMNEDGSKIVFDLIKNIQESKHYLSEIDGVIGDGDHGINMNKGFSICEKKLDEDKDNFTSSMETLSTVLMTEIGGSMGPLYGVFFMAMAEASKDREIIDANLFGNMLKDAQNSISEIGNAKVGDKTLMDTLVPAVNSFLEQVNRGESFISALNEMELAAVKGKESTKDMVAKVGRSSRLGERSRGVIDAGAASCCLILASMAHSIETLINIKK